MFGKKPSIKDKNGHPDLDVEEVRGNQPIVGSSLQWVPPPGKTEEIITAVMTLPLHGSVPSKGQLVQANCVAVYFKKMSDACKMIKTQMLDTSAIPLDEYDWGSSVCVEVTTKLTPSDTLVPKGCLPMRTHYVDADLSHDWIAGCTVTGILPFMNGTPIKWFSKLQLNVETATYESEFVAVGIYLEQVMDLYTKLKKRHTASLFHCWAQDAIDAGIVGFYHIQADWCNPSDTPSKKWGYKQVWQLLQPLLLWQGDTRDTEEHGPGVVKDLVKD
jgi:hypothetical protein